MSDPIVMAAIITAAASIIIAALTFSLAKWHELEVERRHEKLNHYKVLLSGLSGLATDGIDNDDARMRFSLAMNTIALVAPQYVIDALMTYQSNPDRSADVHDKLLVQLLLAIRKDIGLAIKDDPSTFRFHLVGFSPSKSKLQHHK